MTARLINNRYAATRILALAVMLLVIGLQVQEAGHSHGLDDRAAQCMLCKHSIDYALPVGATLSRVVAITAPVIIFDSLRSPRAVLSPVLARGPPAHS